LANGEIYITIHYIILYAASREKFGGGGGKKRLDNGWMEMIWYFREMETFAKTGPA
jgi:hypothetical protein